MRKIDQLRKLIHEELSLPKELVKDVLSFTYPKLHKSFHNGDVIEHSGLGKWTVNETRRKKEEVNLLQAYAKLQQDLTLTDPSLPHYQTMLDSLIRMEYDLQVLQNIKKSDVSYSKKHSKNTGRAEEQSTVSIPS